MAVLALGFAGEALGASIGGTILGISAASIGGFIGSAVGGLIDNMLFPVKQQGPRLEDLSVQSSTYGNAITLLFGPENRLAGNVIFSTKLKETSHKHTTGPFGKGGPSVSMTTYTYSVTMAVAICDCSKRGPIKRVKKIWANKKLIFDVDVSSGPVSEADPLHSDAEHNGGFSGLLEDIFQPGSSKSASLWTSLNFYPGGFTQDPDPVMEGLVGVGEVPAYRGTAYCVIENLQLADYGNRIPSLEFLVEADETITAGAVLSEIVEMCGIDPNMVSTSSIDGEVRGFIIGTQSSGTAAIQPLALVFNFDTAQVGGGVRFQRRGMAPTASVDSDNLAAHAIDEDRPSPIKWSRTLESQMPREASISFPDPDRDYQINSQTARRQAGSAQSNLSSQLPVVVDVDTARRLADRMLWEAWVGRTTANSQTDDRLIGLEAGRVYVFETPAGFEPLRLKSKTRGANGVIELELARDRSAVYLSTARGIAAPTPIQEVTVPAPSGIVVLDIPILQDGDDDTGFYFAVDGESTSWRGADVIRSVDDGETFDEVQAVGFESVIGEVDHLGDGPTVVFDNVNVIRVTLRDDDDELESVTELDVLNGKNAAWIGPSTGEDGEILQFKTATLVAPGIYDLSGLLRGRLGTEYATGTHATGETFVLLEGGSIRRADYSASDWNKERTYKAVSLLTLEADADPVDFTNTGEGKRPLSPVHIASVTAGGDTAITWLRRSRYRQPGLGGDPLALGEAFEKYEVDVVAYGDVVRTLSSTSETVSYTGAEQAADGFGPGDTVEVRVYQVSDVRGRGRPGIAELIL